jgi:hypothetical protein
MDTEKIKSNLKQILSETGAGKAEISFFDKKTKEKLSVSLELNYDDSEYEK